VAGVWFFETAFGKPQIHKPACHEHIFVEKHLAVVYGAVW
jgi:hypothetical protein